VAATPIGYFNAPHPVAFGLSRPHFVCADLAAAQRAGQRIALAASTGIPLVLSTAELLAWSVAMSMDATVIRFFNGRSFRLPVFAFDRAAELAAARETPPAVVSPLSGKAAIAADAFGPVHGMIDDRAFSALLATRGILGSLGDRFKATTAALTPAGPAIEIPTATGDALGAGTGGDALGIGPVVAGIVVAGVCGVTYLIDKGITERHASDNKTAVQMFALQVAHQETLIRWQAKIDTGVDLEPSPLEKANAAAVEELARDGSGGAWKAVGIGAAIGVAGLFGGRYAARRLGAR
jgi:hypothetical protein